MRTIISIGEITDEDKGRVGGKSFVSASLDSRGLKIPAGLCVTTDVYQRFIDEFGLRERIMMELSRKKLEDMRWEEIWDAALRIRTLFLKERIAPDLLRELIENLATAFGSRPVVVRSSAPGEDSELVSFAGLHDSFVNVSGAEAITEKIRLVWASLWSDRALLYRKELHLNVEESTIAVLIQELVLGEVSGVGFGRNPINDDQAVIEAVWGLNEGLVDGRVEPDRWILDRGSGRILSHIPARRSEAVFPGEQGTELRALEARLAEKAPLDGTGVESIFRMINPLEETLGSPPDFEWTLKDGELFVLQARPITTGRGEGDSEGKAWENPDRRPWYMSLQRNFDNLNVLRERIENEFIPEMEAETKRMAEVDMVQMTEDELLVEIESRERIRDRWNGIYWSEFIPFAHGIRLFGQVYNDAVRPDDPFEFMNLLDAGEAESLERNRMIEDLADIIRKNLVVKNRLEQGEEGGTSFERVLAEFMDKFGDLSCGVSQCTTGREGIISIASKMASSPPRPRRNAKTSDRLLQQYLAAFPEDQRQWATEVLELGQSSYRMRDEDNIHLARIEGQLLRALDENKRRHPGEENLPGILSKDAAGEKSQNHTTMKSQANGGKAERTEKLIVTPRQMVGQPASPGLARGPARVIKSTPDLSLVEAGEILVTDAIEPEMTFVVPLVAGIVERRGGMLIHGAIIAREYGLPCVTGIPDADKIIRDGEDITVDGFLGIVIIHNSR